MKVIAIHSDDYGPNDASSPIWTRLLLDAGIQVREVDVRRPDILEQLQGCDGFIWRWAHFGGMGRIARRLLPVVEQNLGIPVYPDQKTCWHYDDKIAQTFLLRAHGVPTPSTWIWFDREGALKWLQSARFPLVLKLAAGAGSTNVKLVHDFAEAALWAERLFARRVTTLDELQFEPYSLGQRMERVKKFLTTGERERMADDGYEVQSGYLLFQEFLPGNDFDTRITVIGDRAFGFLRYNRPNDFRASGSGRLDTDPSMIDPDAVKLAFETAAKVGSQSLAIDLLKKEGRFVVGEISYTFASWAVHACPGHWDARLDWREGQMLPEEAQLADFLKRVQ